MDTQEFIEECFQKASELQRCVNALADEVQDIRPLMYASNALDDLMDHLDNLMGIE